ncbi:Hypothetical predicted protein [Lecanosticta acicola]|uniref:Uncharacterized protein n=1 Tax=Lecanosticta acicola TaxID=111012 RepID=A0AAI8Z2L5_9PEZI|nr:Hypothetical predicted protein [Lecanosticta acicola]
MTTLATVVDLQSVHSLANKLYCRCQEQLSGSKAIARSLRRLRNKLEEAEEVLDEAPTQHEDVRVLQAAGESKNVLNILDLALQHHRSATTRETQDEGFVSDFLTLIESVTSKLSDSLAALEGQKGTAGLLEASHAHPTSSPIFRSPSASTASDDPRRNVSTASTPFSFRRGQLSMISDNTSLSSGTQELTKEKAITPAPCGTVKANGYRSSQSMPGVMEQHKSAFVDPMSHNIDQATSMILQHEAVHVASRYRVVNPDPTIDTDNADQQYPATDYGGLQQMSSTSARVALPTRIPDTTTFTSGRVQITSINDQQTRGREKKSRSPRSKSPVPDNTGESENMMPQRRTASTPLQPTLSIGGLEVVTHDLKRYVQPKANPNVEPTMAPKAELAGLGIHDSQEVPRFYAGTDHKSEHERIASIVKLWNDCRWIDAGEQIASHLDRQLERGDQSLARRLRHLTGVLASLQGQWHRALVIFVSVLNAPITEPSQLDAGDCAAAYWLGDTYALLDRRVEALLAYSIAERSPLFQDSTKHRLHQCIRTDQDACRAAKGVPDTKLWEQERLSRNFDAGDSILNPQIITGGAAKAFLSYVRSQPEQASAKQSTLDPNDGRAFSLWKFGLDAVPWQEMQRLQIDPVCFTPSGPWPLEFDPQFAMANVSNGRLLSHSCDLLQLVTSNHKIAKAGGFRKKTLDCFTHPDLSWLIQTIRQCLRWLGVEWSESSDAQTTFFAARYASAEDRVATIHYFSLHLFRLSFRSGYGVDLCPGGIASARILRRQANFDKGVHLHETKRLRKMVREFLDTAAGKLEDEAFRSTALPVMNDSSTFFIGWLY